MLFKNKKNGKTYRYLAVGIDCTNSRDGTMVVIYCPDDDDHSVYVREYGEFYEKFEELSEEVSE